MGKQIFARNDLKGDFKSRHNVRDGEDGCADSLLLFKAADEQLESFKPPRVLCVS